MICYNDKTKKKFKKGKGAQNGRKGENMYNYLENIKEDVKQYIEDNGIEINEENREEIEEELNDDLFIENSVTGNASGSYTFSTYKAEQNLVGNFDLLKEACEEFGCSGVDFLEKGAKWGDVTIRCYLLGQAISEVLDEIIEE